MKRLALMAGLLMPLGSLALLACNEKMAQVNSSTQAGQHDNSPKQTPASIQPSPSLDETISFIQSRLRPVKHWEPSSTNLGRTVWGLARTGSDKLRGSIRKSRQARKL